MDRFCAQLPTETVLDFPIDFLQRMMSTGIDMKDLVKEAAAMYNDIFFANMLLMPTIYKGEASLVVVINPAGVVKPAAKCRGVSCMIILGSYGRQTSLEIKTVERRVRLFLNKVVEMDELIECENKFSFKNFKAYIPEGETSRTG